MLSERLRPPNDPDHADDDRHHPTGVRHSSHTCRRRRRPRSPRYPELLGTLRTSPEVAVVGRQQVPHNDVPNVARSLTPNAGFGPIFGAAASDTREGYVPEPILNDQSQGARFSLRQPPARLSATICLNIALRADALMVSPWYTATVRAVLL
jgi:hypothetical protein